MDSLNKEQYRASLPGGGVSLVVAGAGTGKTRTLVEKVKNIIKDGKVKPENILILTFSRKAAEEIKDRIELLIGENAKNISAGTFHSFCLGLLRENSRILQEFYGFDLFPVILDKEEKEKLRMDMLKDFIDQFMGLPVRIVCGLLDGIDDFDRRMLKKLDRLGIIDKLRDFNMRFDDYKRSQNLIDFDDMIDFALDLLSKDQCLRAKIIERYKYILVDEFQDTSEKNFKLLRLLLHEDKSNLFLVGDDWQSIYGFRGSRVEYIVNTKRFFPKVKIYNLRINYRSRKEIVYHSNRFIKHNRFRTKKRLRAFKGRGGLVRSYIVESFDEEVEKIRDILISEIANSSDIAILYRNNWQGDFICKNREVSGLIKSNSMKLMTIHSSKGLEFDTVLIVGLSDEIIPDISSDIEEERRLLYVALTRARERLHIIHHRSARGGLSLFANEMRFSDH